VAGIQPVIRSGAPSPSKYAKNLSGAATHIGKQIIMQPYYIQDVKKNFQNFGYIGLSFW